MVILAIDIGNTRISSALFQDRNLIVRCDTPEDLERIVSNERQKIEACAISRVTRRYPEIENQLKCNLRKPIFKLNASSVSFDIRYQHPEKLGADRIANVIASRIYAPRGAIVMDMGTAMHFDIADEKGTFYGGPILPGLETLHQALSLRIPHLPQTPIISSVQAISNTTSDAMSAGSLLGIAGAIERIVSEIRREMGRELPTILTGGSAVTALPLIACDFYVPNLTLEGLQQYGAMSLRKMHARRSA